MTPQYQHEKEKHVIRQMADLLRAGAAMLAERCPVCGLPLFRLRSGEIICPQHGRVFVVRSESEYRKVSAQGVLEELEELATKKISELIYKLEKGYDREAISELREWLNILEQVERLITVLDYQKKRSESTSRRT
ncbi:MAG TPA: hypothetical protein EYH26_03085 [Pyrodictium sp.]|nr:hypothetical protein [Pyrodictium sp.]HIQ56272.1 hypothetical protein [Pyrodictium sp.]